MPRKKKSRRAGAPPAPTAGRKRAQSNYAWHRRVPWVAIAGAAVVVVVGVFIAQSFGVGESAGQYRPGGGVGNHVTEGQAIAYPSYPPAFGPHWPATTTWGFHSEPVPDERAVHNLEHGGVVASYNNIPAESLAALQRLLTTYPRDKFNQVKLVIRPYDRIPAGTIVLTAWNWIDELPAYDEPRVIRFLNAHLNKCCEDVP